MTDHPKLATLLVRERRNPFGYSSTVAEKGDEGWELKAILETREGAELYFQRRSDEER